MRTTYILNEREKATYRGMASRAFERASAYKGAESQYHALFEPLYAMEHFIKWRGGRCPDSALEAEFSRQSGFNGPQTIGEMLRLAADNFTKAFNNSAQQDEHTAALLDGGALVFPSPLIFLPPDENGRGIGDGSKGGPEYQVLLEPHLKMVLEFLQSHEIYTDDLIVHKGKVGRDQMRAAPYHLIEIPRREMQLAVSNQYGQALYASHEMMHPHVWASKTKAELRALPHVKRIEFDKDWAAELAGFLNPQGEKIDPRVFYAQRQKREGSPLTVRLIVETAKEHFEETGEWPKTHMGEVLYGPLKGDQWGNISSTINTRGRGLATENLPEHVKGLATLLEWKGLTVSLFSDKKNLTVAAIVQSAQAHFDETGKWPSAESGEILYGPLKGNKWGNIDAAINTRGRGLDKENLPEHIKGLATLLEWKGLTVSLFSKKRKLTVAAIVKSAQAHFDETGEWPDRNTGEILYGPLKGDKWENISVAIGNRGRGLDKENLPEHVKGLITLMELKGLTVSLFSKKRKLTVAAIVESAQAHFDETGEWPNRNTGEILYGPLKGDKWVNISGAIFTRRRGLDQENLPDEVKGLGSFLKWTRENDLMPPKPPAEAPTIETPEP